MSEFLSRTGPVAPVASATERGPAVRPPVPVKSMRSGIETGTHSAPGIAERTSAAADYAKLKADIADVLAGIPSDRVGGSEAAQKAERSIVALMPDPIVVLPLPPADPMIVAFVAQVAQTIARQTAQTRAAQAHATPIIVEAAAN
ncbi:hypothetical protein [Sphingobium nicotianae]|uniref:Uncharacterized protein n=1 Tax=Sphingobium nicotianae TaxID=2782607 RepID=A0A9X1DAJ2_9SPHN|nr:hypothetical protein [Sphingobium nicotianae]MBT2186475.1 hypothetical protein [Sphingobium nicotianae]